MYTINKIRADHVVDFAAEELKKYLRMMMPRCGEIDIRYDPQAKDGFRLGLMEDFGLDTSESDDLVLDDILHIDTDTEGGIIAGSNPRSVLLSVYRYLTENGCRWLYPGIDGEFIPVKQIEAIKYHKMADCRFRGQCNEGAEFQPNMMEVIDWTPKVGMNIFMIEFDNPKAYYDSYYKHSHNEHNREPEPITAETTLQWKRQCEAEMSKRGLQFHDMGHGWTAEPFGISSTNGWAVEKDNPIPEESKDFIAMTDGVRELWGGVALNTQFCMSNPRARTKVAEYVTAYAKNHTNVDYLHVWLADGSYNHCECDECRKKIPSDWYMMLMNEIDECLTREKLDTRIVFICYTDTTWAPTCEKLINNKRFSFLLAAITRTYTTPVPMELPAYEVPAFVLNLQGSFPEKVEEYIHHYNAWKKFVDCPSMVYEYHFWMHQYRDPGVLTFAKIIYDDIRGYKKNGFNGLIEDGSQRSFFPNGFCFYVYASTLYDTNVDFEDLKKDYFSHAYGEIWQDVVALMEKISNAFCMEYIMGERSSNPKMGPHYNPAHAASLRSVNGFADELEALLKEHKNMPYRAQTVSVRLLLKFTEYCRGLANAFALKSMGADPEAVEAFDRFCDSFGRHEVEIERYYDQRTMWHSLARLLKKPTNFYTDLD